MGESVDIVVSQTGAEDAAAALAAVGTSADTAATSVDQANQSLQFLKTASDAATSPLQATAAAADQAATAYDNTSKFVYNASTNMYDIVTAAQQARIAQEEAANAADKLAASSQQAAAAMQEHSANAEKTATSSEHAKEATEGWNEAAKLLKETLGALGLLLTADKIIELAESYERLEIKLSAVSANTHDLHENMQRLFEISQSTGTAFDRNAAAFQKLAIETSGLNISQKDLLGVVEGVNSAVRLSGGTSEEAGRAMDIFGRSLATGQVEGRIFRTVLRDFPELGQLVAKGLNVGISALTGTGVAATTSAKAFVEGFNKAAEVAEKVGKTIPLTLGQALTTLSNATLLYIGHLNEASGSTNLLARSIVLIANNFETIATVVRIAATVFGSWLAVTVLIPGAISLATTALRAFTAALAANPLGLLVIAITSAIALIYQFGDAISLTADGSISLLGSIIGAWDTLVDAIKNRAIPSVDDFRHHMEDATAKLKEHEEAAKTLAQRLGNDDPNSVSGAAKKATAAIKDNSAAVNTSVAEYQKLELTVRNAMGEMVVATDEWARRSGADFNKASAAAKDYASSAAQSLDSVSQAASQTSQSIQSLSSSQSVNAAGNGSNVQSTNSMLEGGVSTDGGATFHSIADDIAFFKQYGRPIGNAVSTNSQLAWKQLLSEVQSDAALAAQVSAAAHARNIPGFYDGGSFTVGGVGGADSQLVQFMATPGEQVTVQTPAQRNDQRPDGRFGGKQVVVNMHVVTPDANSFRRSQNQTYLQLKGKLAGVI